MSPANRLPELDALFQQDDLVEALENVFPEGLKLSRGTRGRTLKLQRNAGASTQYCFTQPRRAGISPYRTR